MSAGQPPGDAWLSAIARFLLWSTALTFAWAWRGPFGAILVGGLGFALQRGLRYGWWSLRPGALRENYYLALFTAMGRLAKSSGRVTSQHISAAEALIEAYNFDTERRHTAIRAFNRGRDGERGWHEVFKPMRRMGEVRPGLRAEFLQLLIGTLYTATMPNAQRATLDQIASLIGAGPALVQECLASKSAAPEHDAYATLGLSAAADNDEIKHAYRSLMARYHPDKLAAAQLSQEQRQQAEKTVREVRAAYDQLRRLRGFR